MENKFNLEIIWKDEDMIEVKAQASNGRYCGVTIVYTTKAALKQMGEKLKGFPENTEDKYEYSAGNKDSYALLSMKFYTIDKAGHTATQICMEDNVSTEYRPEEKNKIQLEMQFEPAQLQIFVDQLLVMAKEENGSSELKGKPV